MNVGKFFGIIRRGSLGRMGMENMLQLLNLFNQMVDVMEDELKKTEKGDRIC